MMEGFSHRDAGQPWHTGSGAMPAHSRVFDNLTQNDGYEMMRPEDKFFVPSYLEASTYVHKLEQAHRHKMQSKKKTKRATDPSNGRKPDELPLTSLPQGSHRGLSHAVVERGATPELYDLSPLPTRWNKNDLYGPIEVQLDGLAVKFTGSKHQNDRELEACAVRADTYIPVQCGVYYFEVHIVRGKRDDTTIAVGFVKGDTPLTRPVGWEVHSYGFHGDDGRVFGGLNTGRPYASGFNSGDVIGCGINYRDSTIFFTKNGIHLGNAWERVPLTDDLFPSVSLKKHGEHVRVNFGQTPFVYNIDDMMKARYRSNDERGKVQQEITKADTSALEKGLSEGDLVQALVLQFLQHDGYVETARAFADDIQQRKTALNQSEENDVTGFASVQDGHDANRRQRIRRSILEGDIDQAIQMTNAYYPRVLQDNDKVYFKLQCRQFVELVRRTAEYNSQNSAPQKNGVLASGMELDTNGTSNAGDNDLEATMLDYGEELQKKYADHPSRDTLRDIWGLLAYRNPLKEPQVAHLLDKKGRVAVSEELNSAILLSLGKSSRAALETVYAQTSVLLEDLQDQGGAAAFVSINDPADSIPLPVSDMF